MATIAGSACGQDKRRAIVPAKHAVKSAATAPSVTSSRRDAANTAFAPRSSPADRRFAQSCAAATGMPAVVSAPASA